MFTGWLEWPEGLQVNLDTFDEVAKDYRFYEDPGDEFRNPPDGVRTVKQTNKNLKLFVWAFFQTHI